jgi:ribosomal protection tetracycline resistance protein
MGFRLSGVIPADRVHRLQMEVPTLTRGEGVLTTTFDHHEPVRGAVPSRPRTDRNPLDRTEYLALVERGETATRGARPGR